MAMVAIDGRHEAVTMPTGSVLDLNGKTFNGDRLMEVNSHGRMLLMFTEDLKLYSVPRELTPTD